jgi:hypothetical protein
MNLSDRSFWLLNQYGIKYSQNEMLGMKLADGLYDRSTEQYFINYSPGGFLKTEIGYILHWADHMSCRQELAEYERSLNK